MKNYLAEMVDLTGNKYLNPDGYIWNDNEGSHWRSVSNITSISVHHDASHRPHDYDSVARYESEAELHYQELGFGLQYHYKIDNQGTIFAIRPLTTWLNCVGSSENPTTVAICLDGYLHNDSTNQGQDPTREQYEAFGQLLVNLCEEHPEFPATYPDVRPHLDFSSTACPGNRFAPWVLAIQSKGDVLNVPASATYDWPEYQPSSSTPPASPKPSPQPAPLPPVEPKPQPIPPAETPKPTPKLPEPTPQPATPSIPTKPTTNNWLEELVKALTAWLSGLRKK